MPQLVKTNQINVSDKFFSIDSFELVSFKSEPSIPIIGSWPTNNPSDNDDFLNADVPFIKVTGFAADGMDAVAFTISFMTLTKWPSNALVCRNYYEFIL